jgi:hypothetical protein
MPPKGSDCRVPVYSAGLLSELLNLIALLANHDPIMTQARKP